MRLALLFLCSALAILYGAHASKLMGCISRWEPSKYTRTTDTELDVRPTAKQNEANKRRQIAYLQTYYNNVLGMIEFLKKFSRSIYPVKMSAFALSVTISDLDVVENRWSSVRERLADLVSSDTSRLQQDINQYERDVLCISNSIFIPGGLLVDLNYTIERSSNCRYIFVDQYRYEKRKALFPYKEHLPTHDPNHPISVYESDICVDMKIDMRRKRKRLSPELIRTMMENEELYFSRHKITEVENKANNEINARNFNTKFEALMTSTILPGLKRIEKSYSQFTKDEFDSKLCQEHLAKFNALKRVLSHAQAEFMAYRPYEKSTEEEMKVIRSLNDRVYHPDFEQQFDILIAPFKYGIPEKFTKRVAKFLKLLKKRIRPKVDDLNQFGFELVSELTSVNVNHIDVHKACVELYVEKRSHLVNAEIAVAVKAMKSLVDATISLVDNYGPIFVSTYAISAFKASSKKTIEDLESIGSTTFNPKSNCWSFMVDVMMRMENQMRELKCAAYKVLIDQKEWLKAEFNTIASLGTEIYQDDRMECSNYYLAENQKLDINRVRMVYKADVCAEMQMNSTNVRTTMIVSKSVHTADQSALLSHELVSKITEKVFRASITGYVDFERSRMEKIYLIDDDYLEQAEPKYKKRLQSHNADAKRLIRNMPWQEIQETLNEATAELSNVDMTKCRNGMEYIQALERSLRECQSIHRVYLPMVVDPVPWDNLPKNTLSILKRRFDQVALLTRDFRYFSAFEKLLKDVPELSTHFRGAKNELSNFVEYNKFGIEMATSNHVNSFVYWADEQFENKDLFCAAVSKSPETALKSTTEYMEKALGFAEIVLAEIRRRSWTSRSETKEVLEMLKADKIASFLSSYLDSNGLIDGKTCDELHVALLVQMTEIQTSAALKGLYVPIFHDDATSQEISATVDARVSAAVEAVFGYLKANVSDFPFPIGTCGTVECLGEIIRSSSRSFENSKLPVCGATVNMAFRQVIVFVQHAKDLLSRKPECDNFTDDRPNDKEKQLLRQMVNEEIEAFGEEMIVNIDDATNNLGESDKKRLKFELANSTNDVKLNIDQIIEVDEPKKDQSRFAKIIRLRGDSKVISMRQKCEATQEALTDFEKSIEFSMHRTAIFVTSSYKNEVSSMETLVLLYNQPDKLRVQLENYWNFLKTLVQTTVDNLELFQLERNDLNDSISQLFDDNWMKFDPAKFESALAFAEDVRANRIVYFSRVWTAINTKQPVRFIETIAIVIAESGVFQLRAVDFVFEILMRVRDRIGKYLKDSKWKVGLRTTEEKLAAAENEMKNNFKDLEKYSLESKKVEYLVQTLTSCTKPIMQLLDGARKLK